MYIDIHPEEQPAYGLISGPPGYRLEESHKYGSEGQRSIAKWVLVHSNQMKQRFIPAFLHLYGGGGLFPVIEHPMS